MIKFLTPLNTKVETSDLSTFFEVVPGDPEQLGYAMDTTIPSITDNPYKFIYANSSNGPVPIAGIYGASRVFCNSSTLVNLPFSDSQRAFNPIIKYKPAGSLVSICLYTKAPANGDSGYELYNDPKAQTINLVTSNTVTNTQATGNHCYYKKDGGKAVPIINDSLDSATLPSLQTTDVISEEDLSSILNSLIISKAWVAEYVKEQLDIAIPKAVSQAVSESEAVISQRYVSR